MPRGQGKDEAGEAERTVSATQTVWERSLRRVETSDAISRTAGGGKVEAILDTGWKYWRLKIQSVESLESPQFEGELRRKGGIYCYDSTGTTSISSASGSAL